MAGFKITIGGIEISATNASDVAELVRAMGIENNPKTQKIRPKMNGEEPSDEENTFSRHGGAALLFLDLIANHNNVDSAAMQRTLNVKESKGVGPKTRWINAVIEEAGFSLDDVYISERDADGRYWKAGPKIRDAIKAIKDSNVSVKR